MKKKIISLLIIVLVLAICVGMVLTSCGGAGNSGNGSSSGSEASGDAGSSTNFGSSDDSASPVTTESSSSEDGPGNPDDSPGSPAPLFTAIIGTDLHFLSPKINDGGDYFQRMMEQSDAKAMQYIEEITDGFLAQVIARKPDYLILSGDLSFNGEKTSHEELALKLAKVEEAGIKVLAISGNHDVYSETAAAFHGDSYELTDNVTATGFSNIFEDFGFSEALARDEKSLSYTYDLSPDVRALVVDVNTRAGIGLLTEETFDWVREQLEKAKEDGVTVIGVSHQNLLLHNSLFAYGYLIEGSGRLASLYEEYDVLFNLSGHMHIQHIAQSEGGLIDIATSALSISPYQFGVLDFYEDEVKYHTEITDFPSYEDAVKFMRDRSLRSAKRNFSALSEDHQEFYADINTSFFAGRMDSVEWDDEMFKELQNGSLMSGMFLQTVIDDGLKNHTEITIPR